MSTGLIFQVQRFCTDDGPGIRTTVFLKGCPLRCLWCHNPESHAEQAEVLYDGHKCIGCGRCARVCPQGCHRMTPTHVFERADCIGCGACAAECPAEALTFYGKRISAEEAFAEVKRDEVFYKTSGGGVTVSGGEPLLQSAFTSELLRLCKENGIHTAIETSGFGSEDALLSVLAHCDLVLFDVKETDEELHRRYTGVPFAAVLRSMEMINEKNVPFIVRAPIIPTLNDRASHFARLRELQGTMSACRGIQLMPYHAFGAHKYGMLDKPYACEGIPAPTEEQIARWRQALAEDL